MSATLQLLIAATALTTLGPALEQVTGTAPGICHERVDRGPCNGIIENYFFNSSSGRCQSFIYGGCGGNRNRFAMDLACVQICEQFATPPERSDILKQVTGFCAPVCPQPCKCQGTTIHCPGPRGTAPATFSDCAESLDMSNSGLAVLHNGSFHDLIHLERLDLSGNQLHFIPINAFRGLSKLKFIDLSGNQLILFPATLFHSLPALEELHLAGNQLHMLASEVIDNLPNLRVVNMSNNQLKTFSPNPSVPYNQITFDLRNNGLTSFHLPLPKDATGPSLYIGGNPLKCDCHMKDLIAFYSQRTQQVIDHKQARCFQPVSLANQLIMQVNQDQLVCGGRPVSQPHNTRTVRQAGFIQDPSADYTFKCLQELAIGSCTHSMPRVYYDSADQRCKQFTFSGCNGNDNNFASFQACQSICEVKAQRPIGRISLIAAPTTPQTPKCPENEQYSDCGAPCPATCANPYLYCLGFCVKGCICKEGYLRFGDKSGQCIAENLPRCLAARTTAPTAKPISDGSMCMREAVIDAPMISVRQMSQRLVSVTLSASNSMVTHRIFQVNNAQRVLLRQTKSVSSPSEVTVHVIPGRVYRFVAQSVDETTKRRSDFSNVVTFCPTAFLGLNDVAQYTIVKNENRGGLTGIVDFGGHLQQGDVTLYKKNNGKDRSEVRFKAD